MTREQLVERIATALSEAWSEPRTMPWDEQDAEDARIALAAIEAAGFRIVPAEATGAQIFAGQQAWVADPTRRSSTLYRAMVAASTIAPKEGE